MQLNNINTINIHNLALVRRLNNTFANVAQLALFNSLNDSQFLTSAPTGETLESTCKLINITEPRSTPTLHIYRQRPGYIQ